MPRSSDTACGRLVCRCLGVSSLRIAAAAREHGFRQVDEITEHLRAGSGCGTCHLEIEEILADVHGEAFDPALRAENRTVCAIETRARVEASLGSVLAEFGGPNRPRVEALEIEGLEVRLRLAPDDAGLYDKVGRELRRAVCPDLDVKRLD